MADEITPTPAPAPTGTDQTGPLDAGHTTTEYLLAKWTIIAGIALSVLSGVADVANEVYKILPGSPWIGKVGLVAGTLVTVLTTVLYGAQRASLKKAVLNQPVVSDPAARDAVRG